MDQTPTQIGKYRIIREVGRGATATVYLAENPVYPEPVALKHIRLDGKSKDAGKSRRRLMKLLKAEKGVAGLLDHPNIIRIFDAEVKEDQAYIVMEYFDGASLERYCRFENMLPMHRAVGVIFKCCMALDYAYRQGIVHRDIKPGNILVDDAGNVKITDFGLALNVNKSSAADSTFIMGVGSPAYMSPEQIKGYALNQKTDLYSLGVVLFHLLTGRLPFRAKNPAQLIYKIINADPPVASQLVPGLPEQMDRVLRKALEKDLYSRYKNGAEFAKDLAAVRFQLVDDSYVPPDTRRFSALRKLGFFTEFDDVELWETLRISSWRKVDEGSVVVREGENDQRFGILMEGRVEVSAGGYVVAELGEGEVFGELAFLDSFEHKHALSVVALTSSVYLEIHPSALALASEECQELFRTRLTTILARRLAGVGRAFAELQGKPAREGSGPGGFELQLVEG